MAPHDPAAAAAGAARLEWLGWDGRTLRWHLILAQPLASALCIDGIVFERFPASADEVHAVEFDYSPSGRRELAFALDVAGIGAVGTTWRVCHGEHGDRGVDRWTHAPPPLAPLAGTPQLPLRAWAQLPGVAVIVPIYNAAESVRRCLAALARFTPPGVRWILVDDASTDPDIAALLAPYAACAHVRIERHAANRGYTSAVNTGIAAAGTADVVLLNSDTEVGPRWLESLRLAAHGDAAIGTVTAVSDNAGAFSVPELEQYCPPPPRWSLVEAQRALLQQAGLRFPELPTGNGFCMFVKHEVIARIGTFDAQAFPSGYGEENDFCQRAVAAGWRNVIAGNVLVRHERSASFGDARRAALGAQGMAVLRRRYPHYEAEVGATLHGFARRVLDYRVRRTWADSDGTYAQRPPRPRVLLAGACGDEAHALAAQDDHEVFVLTDDPLPRLSRLDPQARPVDVAAIDADARTPVTEVLAAWLIVFAIERVRAPATPGCATIRDAAATIGVPVDASGSADC
jgi:GT2 family glycosyltransferase